MADSDLWTCPKCGAKLVVKNMWHSCGQFTIEELFARCDPNVLETYRALEEVALEVAPFAIVPQKTRFCFQLRTRCAAGTPQKRSIRFHFLARSVISHPRIVKVESLARDQHIHYVKLTSPADVDDQIREWLVVSTEYGEQRNRRRVAR